jgi:AcrR family transcriptional regulator
MPYPTQIGYQAIIACAEQLLEQHGAEALTLASVATTLGVKTPSLYRYIANRDALVRAINEQTVQQLFEALQQGLQANTAPASQLQTRCMAYRHFAHQHPQAYLLAFTSSSPAQRPDPAWLVQLVFPLQTLVAQIVGASQALTALRGLLALIHGFVMLELHGQLQRGGDLEQEYLHSVQAYLAGWNHAGEGAGNA